MRIVWNLINDLDPTDRVGQDHGKRNHRNHISSGVLSSPARKVLLVATRGLPPIWVPTSAVKYRESGDPESLIAIFIFIHFSFWTF